MLYPRFKAANQAETAWKNTEQKKREANLFF